MANRKLSLPTPPRHSGRRQWTGARKPGNTVNIFSCCTFYWSVRIINERRNGKNMDVRRCGRVEVLTWHLPGGPEGNRNTEFQSG